MELFLHSYQWLLLYSADKTSVQKMRKHFTRNRREQHDKHRLKHRLKKCIILIIMCNLKHSTKQTHMAKIYLELIHVSVGKKHFFSERAQKIK